MTEEADLTEENAEEAPTEDLVDVVEDLRCVGVVFLTTPTVPAARFDGVDEGVAEALAEEEEEEEEEALQADVEDDFLSTSASLRLEERSVESLDDDMSASSGFLLDFPPTSRFDNVELFFTDVSSDFFAVVVDDEAEDDDDVEDSGGNLGEERPLTPLDLPEIPPSVKLELDASLEPDLAPSPLSPLSTKEEALEEERDLLPPTNSVVGEEEDFLAFKSVVDLLTLDE